SPSPCGLGPRNGPRAGGGVVRFVPGTARTTPPPSPSRKGRGSFFCPVAGGGDGSARMANANSWRHLQRNVLRSYLRMGSRHQAGQGNRQMAQTFTWIGNAGTLEPANTSSNWSPLGPPNSGDTGIANAGSLLLTDSQLNQNTLYLESATLVF